MNKNIKKLIAMFVAFTMIIGYVPFVRASGSSADTKQLQESSKLKLYQEGYLGKAPGLSQKLRGSSTEKEAYNAIYNSIKNMESNAISLKKYNFTLDQAADLISQVVNDHPEFYYMRASFRYNLTNNRVNLVQWEYTVSKTTKKSMDTKFNAAVKQALSYTKSGMTNLEKAMVLHDYLIEKVTYTFSSNPDSRVYNAYGALVDGKAVCQGYTLAYNYLMSKLKISNKFVPSNKMNHAWNLVYINKAWYHVDVTWDDPDIYGQYYHDNFLISNNARKKEIEDQKLTPVWDISTTTGSAYDNYYWRDKNNLEEEYYSDKIYKFYYNSGKWNFSDDKGNYYEKKRLDDPFSEDDIKYSGLGRCNTVSGNNIICFIEGNLYKVTGGTPSVLLETNYPVLGLMISGDTVKYSYYTGSLSAAINKKYIKTASFVWNKTAPVFRSASAAGYNQINLTWSPCGGNVKSDVYEIYRSTDGKKYSKIASKSFSDSSYKNTKVATGVTYYYKICRYDKSNNKRYYSSVKTVKTLPTSSKITYAKATTYNKATLKWSKSSGAYGYTIYRATSAKGKYKAIKSTRSTSYANGGLDTGRTYYYKVRPYSKVGSKPVYGSYSGYKAIKPKLATISKASVKKTGRTKAKVSWKKVSGASGYVVYKSTKKSSGYKKIKTTKGSSYTYSKCTRKKRNYFRVRAYRTVRGKRIYSGYRTVSVKM